MTPRVSVIMTVRNGAEYLRETLDAIATQTFHDYELVINDNGSTDGTPGILEEYASKDSRIRRIGIAPGEQNTFTQGIARALAAAQAPYVAVNDADDVPRPTRLERQLAVLDADPGIALVASSYEHMDAAGGPLGTHRLPATHGEIVDAFQERGVIAHSSVMYRRELAIAAGGYQERMTFASDTALWVEMARRGARFATIPDPLIRIRRHAGQTSLMPGQQAQRYLEPLEIFGRAGQIPGVSLPARLRGMLARQKLALRYGWALWQSGRWAGGVAGAGYWLLASLGPPLRHGPAALLRRGLAPRIGKAEGGFR